MSMILKEQLMIYTMVMISSYHTQISKSYIQFKKQCHNMPTRPYLIIKKSDYKIENDITNIFDTNEFIFYFDISQYKTMLYLKEKNVLIAESLVVFDQEIKPKIEDLSCFFLNHIKKISMNL